MSDSCKLELNHNSNKEVAMISVFAAKKNIAIEDIEGALEKKKKKSSV